MSNMTHSKHRNFFDLYIAKIYKNPMYTRPESNVELTQGEKDVLLKHFPEGICAFDLEMTGLSPIFDKIIEIAAVRLTSDGEVKEFHALVNPLITIPPHTIEYHGLTNEDLKDSPTLKKPLKDFVDFYGSLPLVAHSALFDASFIVRGIHEYNYNLSLSDVYDSCKFARLIYRKNSDRPDNFKLSTLAEYYHFKFNHHRALDDAYISLKIFAKCLIEYRKLDELRPLKDMAYIFKLSAYKKAADYILPNKLNGLREFVQTQTVVCIKYKGSTDTTEEYRKVKPISILPMPQGLMLYGECLQTNLNKYFKIRKVQAFKAVEKK
jgi:DNA polymerase III epsilon subunit family exonuclease